ncbi:hypothetical protein [Arthrobacter sp. H14]|uniref:hypothetical protein n=1 Tax=Arthrobacter sp. H14 TaxID=1312959 RepID=UPI0004B82D07|nr:hypothetical protein [Arthrobacter sp. H14]
MNNSEHDPYDPDQDNDPVPDDAAVSGGDNTGDRRNESAGQPSDDEVWRDLVSRLEQTDSEPDPAQNQNQDQRDGQGQRQDKGQPGTDSESAPAPDPVLGHPRSTAPQPRRMDREHLGGPRDYTPEEEEDDSFVPEDPPSPLAGTEPLVVLAWCGAIGGPLVLLLSAFFWRSMPMLAVVCIIAAFLASVVFLLMRLPSERSDDNDDGAVV